MEPIETHFGGILDLAERRWNSQYVLLTWGTKKVYQSLGLQLLWTFHESILIFRFNYLVSLPNVYFHQLFSLFLWCFSFYWSSTQFFFNNKIKTWAIKLGKSIVTIKIKETKCSFGVKMNHRWHDTKKCRGKIQIFSLLLFRNHTKLLTFHSSNMATVKCDRMAMVSVRWGSLQEIWIWLSLLSELLRHENIVVMLFSDYSTDNSLVYFQNSQRY